MATDFKTVQPTEYYRKFLEQDVRPDGRELGEVRPTTLNVGSITTADGSALIKLGNTTVICGIKGEITSPKSEEPKKGFIIPNVDLPPLCSPNFKPGPPSEQAQAATLFMEDFLKNSECFDENELCIQEGKFCWVLFCDIICLDYDGNLTDACTLALLAALKTGNLPTVTINEETGVPEVNMEKKRGFNVSTFPVSTTLAIFDDKIILADPTREEESLATGAVTVVTTEDGAIKMVHKPGGSQLSEHQLQDCISRAHSHATNVRRLVDETLMSVER